MMNPYEMLVYAEVMTWQKKMLQKPSFLNNLSKIIQVKISSWIPERIHNTITAAIKQMIRGVLFSSTYTTSATLLNTQLQEREQAVLRKISIYKNTAAVEGGITGAGGIILGLAEFPILIAIKLKLLFEIASLYGFDVQDYKERIFILNIFELTFSSDENRKKVYLKMADWKAKSEELPDDIREFDWRTFQQEYRDYIDLAKMAQLIPIIGAPIGVMVNYRLIKKLGLTAMNTYRMRILGL